MQLQDACGSSPAVELVDVLRDDRDLATLPAQPLLALGDGPVGGVGLLGEHELTAVVVKLPNAGRVLGEGLRSGDTLGEGKKRSALEGTPEEQHWDPVRRRRMVIPALAIFSSSLQRL